MTDVDLAGLMVAAAASLYGFVVAYYIFARLLQSQERFQAHYELNTWKTLKQEGFDEKAKSFNQRAIWLDFFLIPCTAFFVVSLTFNVGFILSGDAVRFLIGGGAFIVLVWFVAVWFLSVTTQHLRERLREGRGYATLRERAE